MLSRLHTFRISCRKAFGYGWVLGLVALPAWAAPYIPKHDDQVLERLPFKPNDPVARELIALRATLQRNPQDKATAVKLGWRYYELVAEEGDPRYLGYAQAALAPWWNLPTPPVDVQVLRASLRQFRHDFAGALADLDQALDRDPSQARRSSRDRSWAGAVPARAL